MEHHHDHHDHDHDRGSSLLLVILFNTVITVAEFTGGILSGSLSLVSDAWHNFSDVLSLMLGYAGEKVSMREGGPAYTFGLRRFEVLVALVNALTLVVIGIYIVYEAAQRFTAPLPINLRVMLPVAFIGLAGNALSIIILFRRREESINIRAAFLHLAYDAISSVAVIAGAILISVTGKLWIDLAMSLLIVVMIVRSSAGIIAESMRIFLQGAPAHLDPGVIYDDIKTVDGVDDVHGLHVWSVSSREVFLSCHICLKDDCATKGDEVILAVNSLLEDRHGIHHTALQVETTPLCSTGLGDCCNRKV